MKNSSLYILIATLLVTLLMVGCKGPGMTKKEVNRRHIDTINTNTLLIQEDVDRVLLLDQPSRQTDYIVR